jgi:hypothetical protein
MKVIVLLSLFLIDEQGTIAVFPSNTSKGNFKKGNGKKVKERKENQKGTKRTSSFYGKN